MKIKYCIHIITIFSLLLSCGQKQKDVKIASTVIKGLGLSEQQVINSWGYTFGRFLVIRQEHIDLAEEGVDYNVIKYNELGKAGFVNPNLDVAYIETWFAVDENTPVILEIPQIEGRYYTAQIMDEWADILYNINERNFADQPYGKYALCLQESNPQIPEDAMRIDLPSSKAKMVARIERKGNDQEAVKLQHSFKVSSLGTPKINPAVEIPMFTNSEPITIEVFAQPLLNRVLNSAPDRMSIASDMQMNTRKIADFIQDEANRVIIDQIIKQKAFPALVHLINNNKKKRGGWIATTGHEKGFGDNFWFRTAANYAGIWWNNNKEVVYFIGETDDSGAPLNGDNIYIIHLAKEDIPENHVNAYWSLTLTNLPDYRLVPNKLNRYNFNNISNFAYEYDGSLKIYISAELPDDAPSQNWLPAPKGKPFSLNFGAYVPKPEIISGEYSLPPIKKYIADKS